MTELNTGLHYPVKIDDLPENWAAAYVGDFSTELESGFACGAHSDTDIGVVHVRPYNVSREGKLDFETQKYVPLDHNDKRLKAGDVLFNNTNSPDLIGKTSVVSGRAVGLAFSNHMTRVAFAEGIDPAFAAHQLHYLWSSRYFLHRCVKHVNQASISTDDLGRTVPFVCPPTNEQRRIVEKIETLFADLDAGVESLTRARARLALYRQSVLKAAFEGRLTADWRAEHSAEWPLEHLGDHLSFVTSGSRGWAKYYSDSGDTFVRAQNLKHDRLDLADIAYVTLPKGKTEGVRTRILEGDVLVTITGANVTKTAPVLSDLGTAYVSQHVALCRPKDTLDTKYLHWFLVAEAAGRKQLTDAAYGAGKPGLNLQNIKDVVIPVPEKGEQWEIIRRLEATLSNIDALEAQIDDGLARSKALRQSILKRAFAGQLVAQDPNDEPAHVLLERIKAEKAAAPKAKRRRKANA